MAKEVGTGMLFQEDAKSRFFRISSQRYHSMIKRLAKKKIPVTFSLDEFRQWLFHAFGSRYDGFVQCEYCTGFFDLSEVAIDHRQPLSRGGSAGLDNLALPCSADNSRKGSLTPVEYKLLLDLLRQHIPLGMRDILSRLEKANSLAAGSRANAAIISDLKKEGHWQQAQAARREARKAKERTGF